MVLIDLHNTTWFQLRQIIENDFNSTNTNLISNFLSDNQFIPTVDWNFCSNRNQLMSESARRNAMEWRRRHIILKQSQIRFRPDKWASSVNEDYRKSDNTRENTNRSFDLKLITAVQKQCSLNSSTRALWKPKQINNESKREKSKTC